jgi:NADPH:quinone reductase-like Zn-dependent oxidoreductase
MRALVTDPSASPPLALAEVPDPAPGPGQVLIEMEAASVNRGEVRAARRQPAGKVIGWDVAGTVAALGEGVDQFEVGQRVVAWARDGGSFAERVAAPADWVAPLPAACDSVKAATLPIAGLTALGILRMARVHAGDRVLVTGAAGGVGLLTVQLARDTGAKVTGQARTEERGRVVAEAGAEPLLHPGDGSDVDGSYDVVLDGIGGPMFGPLVRATAPHGRMVVYGNSADAESTFRVEDFYPKGVTIHGFRVFINVPADQGVKDLARLADEVASGRLAVHVQATAPLADALDMIGDLYDRKITGKAVITRV